MIPGFSNCSPALNILAHKKVEMNPRNFFAELKRRNVYEAAGTARRMSYSLFFNSLGEPVPQLFVIIRSAVRPSLSKVSVPLDQYILKRPPIHSHEIVLPFTVVTHVTAGNPGELPITEFSAALMT